MYYYIPLSLLSQDGVAVVDGDSTAVCGKLPIGIEARAVVRTVRYINKGNKTTSIVTVTIIIHYCDSIT